MHISVPFIILLTSASVLDLMLGVLFLGEVFAISLHHTALKGSGKINFLRCTEEATFSYCRSLRTRADLLPWLNRLKPRCT
jgi:hypothetical protein